MTTLGESFTDRLSDRINPIVVKELRQAVSSWFVTVAIIVFLAIQVVVLAFFLIFGDIHSDFSAGGNAFALLQCVLVGTCMIFIPTYTGVRLAAERANVDLMFVTSIRPRSIIIGKLGSAMVLTLVLFSAAMPFLTFTYLLRGIDLPTIFLVLLMGFVAVAVFTQLTILWACLPRNMVLLVLTGLGLLLTLLVSIGYVLAGLWFAAYSGIGSQMGTSDFWGVAAAMAMFVVTWAGLWQCLSIALISPQSTNRMLPMRVFVTAVWLVSGIVAGIIYAQSHDFDVLIVWLVNTFMLLTTVLVITICEREDWGPRLAARIPRSWLGRVLSFGWFTGWAGGMVWWGLIMGATVGYMGILYNDHYRVSSSDIEIIIGMALYIYAYCGTAVVLRRTMLRNRLMPALTWLLVLATLFVLIVLPVVTYFLIHFDNMNRIDRDGAWLVGLPVMLWENRYRDRCLAFVGVWSALVFMITAPMAWRAFHRFHRDRAGQLRVAAAAAAGPPIPPVQTALPGGLSARPPDMPPDLPR